MASAAALACLIRVLCSICDSSEMNQLTTSYGGASVRLQMGAIPHSQQASLASLWLHIWPA